MSNEVEFPTRHAGLAYASERGDELRRFMTSVAASAACLMVLSVTPALASEGGEDRIVNAADRAVAAAGQPESVRPEPGLSVTMSAQGDHAVTVRRTGMPPARLVLPATPGDDVGVRAGNKRVFRSAERNFAIVAEPVADGVRGMVVVDNADAPTRYRYNFELPEGATLAPRGDGGIAVQVVTNGISATIGEIAPAWAIDAMGKSVSTWYEIAGTAVTQVVQHQQAAYPVVADPKLTYGRGVYLNLWGWEGNAIGNVLGAVIGVGGFVGCNVANVTGWAGTIIKIICNAGAGKNAVSILKGLGAKNLVPNWCYQNRILPSAGGWRAVDAKNCQ
ncbi:hypothetical protein [Amycolatopsis magusensis]|uniref:hypothetical protein n=1 Tax=Amycolatopsis magusensis TaxID=882444 RepID=UPI003C2CFF81